MKLPFKMRQETSMEKYRAETFWTKEPETIAWIESFKPHDVFFDVGANVGVYSLFAASLYPEMTIRAFEPFRPNYEVLFANKNLNQFVKLICYWAAIGKYSGLTILEGGGDQIGASGAQMCGCKGERVPILALDDFSPDTLPTHVKIDIDGQELEVVKGMTKTLPFIKSILIEVSNKSKEPITDILLAAGFSTDNRFNSMSPHSRERRLKEGIDAENIIFDRRT